MVLGYPKASLACYPLKGPGVGGPGRGAGAGSARSLAWRLQSQRCRRWGPWWWVISAWSNSLQDAGAIAPAGPLAVTIWPDNSS
jgi:hypothetical protein